MVQSMATAMWLQGTHSSLQKIGGKNMKHNLNSAHNDDSK